jgi:hypothetical protein
MVYPMRREGKLARVLLRQMMKNSHLISENDPLSGPGAALRSASPLPSSTTFRSRAPEQPEEMASSEQRVAKYSNL